MSIKMWMACCCFFTVLAGMPYPLFAQTQKQCKQMQLLAYEREVLGGARQHRIMEVEGIEKNLSTPKRIQYFIYLISPVAIADTQCKQLQIKNIAYAFQVVPVTILPVSLVPTEMPGTAPDTLVKATSHFVYQLVPQLNQVVPPISAKNNYSSTLAAQVILTLKGKHLYDKKAIIKTLPPLALQ